VLFDCSVIDVIDCSVIDVLPFLVFVYSFIYCWGEWTPTHVFLAASQNLNQWTGKHAEAFCGFFVRAKLCVPTSVSHVELRA